MVTTLIGIIGALAIVIGVIFIFFVSEPYGDAVGCPDMKGWPWALIIIGAVLIAVYLGITDTFNK